MSCGLTKLTAMNQGCSVATTGARSRSHLTACHSVNRIVDEENGNLLAAICGMHNLGGADSGEIAIALIRNHDFVGTCTLDCGGGRGSASVGHLDVADIEVVVSKHRAADGAHEDCVVFQAEFVDGFRDKLVSDPMAAARTVVRLMLQITLALVTFIERIGLGVDEFVTVVVRFHFCDSRLCILSHDASPCFTPR